MGSIAQREYVRIKIKLYCGNLIEEYIWHGGVMA
jgi:hypothetical protein